MVSIVVVVPFTVRSPVTTTRPLNDAVDAEEPNANVFAPVVPRLIVVAFVVAILNVAADVVISPPLTARSPVRVNPTNCGLSAASNPKSTAAAATPFVVRVTEPCAAEESDEALTVPAGSADTTPPVNVAEEVSSVIFGVLLSPVVALDIRAPDADTVAT